MVERERLDLLSLNESFDILRTGVGLDNADHALKQLPDPKVYAGIIHFGVSGSTSEALRIGQIVRGRQFLCKELEGIELPTVVKDKDSRSQQVTFFSSREPITDEDARHAVASLGAEAVDMESYSIAKFCLEEELPLLAIRCISDRAGKSTPTDFKQHYRDAAEKLQLFLLEHYLTAPGGTK